MAYSQLTLLCLVVENINQLTFIRHNLLMVIVNSLTCISNGFINFWPNIFRSYTLHLSLLLPEIVKQSVNNLSCDILWLEGKKIRKSRAFWVISTSCLSKDEFKQRYRHTTNGAFMVLGYICRKNHSGFEKSSPDCT